MGERESRGCGFLVIAAFLLGMIIGMFISPVNGISIGCNNNILNDTKDERKVKDE